MARLLIELPGLLEPPYRPDIPHPISSIETPVLDEWLSVADRISCDRVPQLASYGIGNAADAYYGALAHHLPDAEKHAWLRADLVECRPDALAVYLLGNRHLGLTDDELKALANDINALLMPEGIRWYPISAWSGYLSIPSAPALTLTPLPEALLMDQTDYFPRGADAAAWQRRLTELQMLLFEHPVNQARHARGSAPVNAIYLWAYQKNRTPRSVEADLVISDSAMIRGMVANTSQADVLKETGMPEVAQLLKYEQVHMVLTHLFWLRRQGLIAEWQQFVLDFERRFLAEITKSIKSGLIEEVVLLAGDGHAYRLGRSQYSWFGRVIGACKRWWQK